MGIFLCTERVGRTQHFEQPADSPRVKSNESFSVSSVLKRASTDIPPETIHQEESGEKCVLTLDQNSEQKPSVDSTGDEKRNTNLSVPGERFEVVHPAKDEKSLEISYNSSDWLLVASEGMDDGKLRKSVIKPLPDVGNVRLPKRRSFRDDEREMEKILTQVMYKREHDRSSPSQSSDGYESYTYTSSHR